MFSLPSFQMSSPIRSSQSHHILDSCRLASLQGHIHAGEGPRSRLNYPDLDKGLNCVGASPPPPHCHMLSSQLPHSLFSQQVPNQVVEALWCVATVSVTCSYVSLSSISGEVPRRSSHHSYYCDIFESDYSSLWWVQALSTLQDISLTPVLQKVAD